MFNPQIEDIARSLGDISGTLEKMQSKASSLSNVYRLRNSFLLQLETKDNWGRSQLTQIMTDLIKKLEEGTLDESN